MGCEMRIVLGSLLVFSFASVGYGFNADFDPISGFVDSSTRQSSLNDNIPAVFGTTFAASLFANLIFQSVSQNSNTIGR